ncbi:MAG: FtsX-like permease family protein [Bacteroidales bacterium]|nr:FtsX-like permease family protein [Bacteroidales bacterium]
MIQNLFKYSFRALSRQKSYVFINLLGLSAGIACSLIIGLFIFHEMSYDQYNEKRDRIYRVILHGNIGGQELKVTSTASPIGPTMRNEFPEVESFLRMNGWGETIVKSEEEYFTEDQFVEADSSFFNFFTIKLLRGQHDKLLNEPHTLVLSESTAHKIFGESDPIDKMLQVGNDSIKYRVTGIMEDIPETSHFKANIIGSFMTNDRANDNEWLSNSFNTYVLLHPNASTDQFDTRFKDMIVKYVGPEITKYLGISIEEFTSKGNTYALFLQPLADAHLDPTIQQDLKPANDPKYLIIFGIIGFLIIVIAGINFMNLSTAQAIKRAKEVGIKKVSGSSAQALIIQFLFETIILSYLSVVGAIVISELSLPYINNLLDLKLKLDFFNTPFLLPLIFLFATIFGLLAGSYPAFYLSSFDPAVVLKGKLITNGKKYKLRSILVVVQFTFSILLIVGTMIMYRQINFMLDKNLGFDKENILVINRASALRAQIISFKNTIQKIPGVMSVAASTAVPGHSNNNNGYMLIGRPDETFLLQTNWIDFDYLATYKISLADGRNFDPNMQTYKNACLVNQSSIKKYLIQNPFESQFRSGGAPAEEPGGMPIIGVVNDFHYESLRNEINPYIFRFKNENMQWGYVSIRLAENAPRAVVDEIEKVWAGFTNNNPMQFFFMDKDYERMYREEKQNASLAVLFTILGILIAALGLYGLTAFTMQMRTKEIGVRKTFGASIYSIWLMIAKEIGLLLFISSIIACPLIYWVADDWLQNFHYHIQLNLFDFLSGIFISVIIAMATISYKTIKIASLNPSISLRYE